MHYPPETQIMASLSNHELTGVQNWGDLGDQDCEGRFKNEFEAAVGFPITSSSVLELYENQLNQLIDHGSERNVQISHNKTEGSMSEALPTILERFRFADGGNSAGTFIKAILA